MQGFENIVNELRKVSQSSEIAEKQPLAKKLNYTAAIFEALASKNVDPHDFEPYVEQVRKLLSNDQLKSRHIVSFYGKLINFCIKQYGYVPQGYYQNQWMAIGMAAFGLPLGVVFALSIDNMAFMAIGLPIGLPIGMAVGAGIDKEVKAAGKQLEISHDF